MTGSGLFGWTILGGLLVLLISEAVVMLIPYVKQSVEGGLIEAARRAGATRKTVKKISGQGEDDQEDRRHR